MAFNRRRLFKPITQRWSSLPVRRKLALSITAVLMLAIIIIDVSLRLILNTSLTNNARQTHATRLADTNALLVKAFDDYEKTILTFGTGMTNAVTAYNSAYQNPVRNASLDNDLTVATVKMNTALAENLAPKREIFAEARFLNAAGMQVARITRNAQYGIYSVVTSDKLVSEAQEPYFIQLSQLRAGEVYLVRVNSTARFGGGDIPSDVLFEYALPFKLGDQPAGYLFVDVVATQTLLNLVGTSARDPQFGTALVDETRRVLATNTTTGAKLFDPLNPVENSRIPSDIYRDAPLLFEARTVEVDDPTQRDIFVSSQPIPIRTIRGIPNWYVVIIQHAHDVLGLSNLLQGVVFWPPLVVLLLVGTSAVFLSDRLTQPLQRLTDLARQIASGNREELITIDSRDEFGQVGQALNSVAQQTSILIETLETRVNARTREIENTAQISRDLANIRQLDSLLQRTVDALRDRFGFYHVQVFLLDDKHEYAVLRSSTGEVGRKLLERNHKLAVGSFSIIGQVTEKERAFITLDTRNSEVPHKFNPLLPNTRSEMALPLQIGGRIIGALDVQSELSDAFDDNTVRVFQVLADQLAASIENTRLLNESLATLQQVDRLNRQLTREGWQEYIQTKGVSAFTYDMMEVQPLDDPQKELLQKGLNVDIRVRGETVGILSAIDESGHNLSAEDRRLVQSIADRVALAIDNVRLVERTRAALTEIERLYQASRKLGAAPDLASVFTIVAEQVSTFEQVQQIGIWRSGPEPVPSPQWMTYVFDWQRNQPPSSLPGRHVALDQFPLLKLMSNPKEPLIVNDLEQIATHETTYRSFKRADLQSFVLMPLSTATRWFGLLVVASGSKDTFNTAFVQFVRSVADQLSVAIENRQLFEEAQVEARRNRALAEAAQIVSEIGVDFATVAAKLLQVGADAAVYDRWWFGQLEGGTRLQLISGYFPEGYTQPFGTEVVIDGNTTALGEVVRLGTPVIVNERNHPNLEGLSPAEVEALGKHMALPIRIGEGTLTGALLVGRPFGDADLNEEDWQLVGTLVNQLSVAAENRRLFAETQAGRETLQSVLNSLPAGIIVVDAQSRQISLANRQISRFFGIDMDGRTPTSTLLPAAINPRSPDFAPLRVLNTGQAVTNENVEVDLGDVDKRYYLVNAAPIFSGNQLIAAVSVFTDTTDLHQMEVALEENLNEISQIYESSRVLNSQTSEIGIIQAAYGQMAAYASVDAFYIILRNAQDEIAAIYQNIDEQMQSLDALPFERDLLPVEGEAVYADRPIPRRGEPPLHFLIVHALRVGASHLGWVASGYTDNIEVRLNEERFVAQLGDQIAVAIETLRLGQQTATALRETETLYQATRAINAASSLEGAAEIIREQLLTFQPDRIDVFLIADRTKPDRIEWKVRYEAEPPPLRSTLLIENSYISDTELLGFDPVFIENADEANDSLRDLIRRLPTPDHVQKIASQASLPLKTKDASLGRIVMSFFKPRPYTSSDRKFMLALAEQATTVVDNALLYQQTNSALEEATALYNASRFITDSESSQDILDAVVNHALASDISRAMLVLLLGEDWSDPNAYIEIAADWVRSEDTSALLTGLRFGPSQFPAWRQISSPDMVYVDSVAHEDSLDEESRVGFLTMDIGSFVTVPLQVGGKALGAFLIGAEEPRNHNEREMRIYKGLADQAAIALQNRALLRQAEGRARQLETSAQVSKAATSTLDLNELLNATVELIKQSFKYDHAQIFLISDDGKRADLKASTGEPGKQLLSRQHSLGVGSPSVIGRVTSSGKLYNVLDTSDARQTHRPNEYLPNTRSELALPLYARGKIIGALDVQSNLPGAFREEDEKVLESLADQIAVAIDNARLFELSTRRLEEQRFLFNVTRTAAAVEIDMSLNKVTRQILQETGSELVVLFLLDQDGKRMLTSYAADPQLHYVIPTSLPIEQEVIARILRTGQYALFQDKAAGQLFAADDVPDVRSMVAVPLSSGGTVIGVLAVFSVKQRAYTSENAELLLTLGGTLTAVVQNGRLLADLQEANQRLREVDKLKSQFLANMSHELRTPLNSIIGFSRVILKGIDGPLNETQTQDLTTIHESGKHLLNLVNDILDQAKIEAGKMELAPDYFKLDEMIKSVMSTAVGLVKDKPIRLHQEIQANLPQVYADEFRTRQVLLNILSNASKFTKQGSITVNAFTVNDGGREMVQVSVTDTGIGISKENIRRVFAQFEQVDNSTARGAEGTGLGMPIAKSLIEMMGGRIWLESEVGVGSTFSITLPTFGDNSTPEIVLDGAEDQTLPPELVNQVEQAISQTVNPRPLQRFIVAIDDEPGMINMYRRYLAKHGFEVIGTTNPAEATDLIVTYQPNVVLLDVNMPSRNGWEVLEELKDIDETFEYPVIVCSIEDDKARAYRLGAADYLVKPFLEEDLLAALRRVQLEHTLPGVLVVNTDQEALSRIRAALTAEHDVLRYLEANTPDQALDVIENHRPNLVIFDLRAPGLDILALIRQIRKNPATAGARLLVIPGSNLAPEALVTLAENGVQLETGVTDEMIMPMVRIQLGLNGQLGD
jgi:GAF domain-containing protein/DNA-binding response OmpR family regulator/HAMP domain-containing protein